MTETELEETFLKIQEAAIEEAERVPVELADCLAGLRVMHQALTDRIAQVESELS